MIIQMSSRLNSYLMVRLQSHCNARSDKVDEIKMNMSCMNSWRCRTIIHIYFSFSFLNLLKTWACEWGVQVQVSKTWDGIKHKITQSYVSWCHQIAGWPSSHCFSFSSLFWYSLFEGWHHKRAWGMLGKWVILCCSPFLEPCLLSVAHLVCLPQLFVGPELHLLFSVCFNNSRVLLSMWTDISYLLIRAPPSLCQHSQHILTQLQWSVGNSSCICIFFFTLIYRENM